MGPRIRLGHMARATHRPDGVIVDESDVIQGMVLMLKGAEEQPSLDGIHKKVDELNNRILPEGVKVVPMLDRSDLLHYTLHTVEHNLVEGMILVTIILLLFLGNVRAALIVAITIPFSLMFASIWLDLSKIPANLLSLGALDFGMMVDGAVVMVENIVRHLNRRNKTGGVCRRRNPTRANHRDHQIARRSHPRGLSRGPTTGVLCHRHHHHRLLADFHAPTFGRQIILANGLDGSARSSRGHDLLDPCRAGPQQMEHFPAAEDRRDEDRVSHSAEKGESYSPGHGPEYSPSNRWRVKIGMYAVMMMAMAKNTGRCTS